MFYSNRSLKFWGRGASPSLFYFQLLTIKKDSSEREWDSPQMKEKILKLLGGKK
jgi:hypothetical protein